MKKYLSVADATKLTELEIKAKEKAISLYDEVIEALAKFDGKTITKRIETALKKIDSDLYIKQDSSFKVCLYISDRSFETENGNWIYLDFSEVGMVYASYYTYGDSIGILHGGNEEKDCPYEQLNTLNFENLKALMLKQKTYQQDRFKTLKEQLEHVNEYKQMHDDLLKQVKDYRGKVDYTIRQNFDLNSFDNVY